MRLENKRRLEIRVSWNEIHRHMRELAGWIHELRKEGRPVDIIIGVTRGGLTFEAVLARELNIRENIETIGISSYHGMKQGDEVRIVKPIGAEVMAKVKEGGKQSSPSAVRNRIDASVSNLCYAQKRSG